MKANYDYYNHRYYNYDYEDMRELSFSCDRNAGVQITSKIYPTKIDVKIDEDMNRPYLYYEGVVQTNKGPMKITFPRLDLVLDTIETRPCIDDIKKYDIAAPLRYVYKPTISQYEMTTKFSNNGEDTMFELRMFDADDYMSMKEHFDRKWNE